MKGNNLYKQDESAALSLRSSSNCVFISHRLADLDTARSVASYLTDTVGVNIYFSDRDEDLKQALGGEDHEKVVGYIDRGIKASTHLLGIISNRTKGSWWVPYEFGACRQRQLVIAQLLLEEVTEAPSYLKIAEILRDTDDLAKWAKTKLQSTLLKLSAELSRPMIPRVAPFRSEYPRYS